MGAKEQAQGVSAQEKAAEALIEEFLRHPDYAPIYAQGILDAERATLKTFIHFLQRRKRAAEAAAAGAPGSR